MHRAKAERKPSIRVGQRPSLELTRSLPVSPGAVTNSHLGIYAAAIFLSAFLLFQVQLVMGKFILPHFGGGPSVWSTSLLVFQALLLAGYGYAALICANFPPRVQGTIHLTLIFGSAFLIAILALAWRSPILPASPWISQSGANPVGQIFLLLITAVGVQSLLLSSTSPLLQKWFSSSNGQRTPYRLYALSNLGSMLGLLTYPFLIERFLTLPVQAWLWAAGYAAFLALAGTCASLQLRRVETPFIAAVSKRKKAYAPPPKLLWMSLAACASTMLLATTNLICQEIAVVPLLWVVPLCLYLLSFIVSFDHARWYRREIFHPLYLVLGVGSFAGLANYGGPLVPKLVVLFCFALLAVCMVCHGELARLKPDPEHLTSFYLMVSAGGALGSMFVVFLAPRIFTRFWEFQLALVAAGVLLVLTLIRDKNSWFHKAGLGPLILVAAGLIFVIGAYHYTQKLEEKEGQGSLIDWRGRNFFGIETVAHNTFSRYLVSGHTLHGLQNSDPATQNEPTGYYFRNSGIGLLLDNFPHTDQGGLRVGVIGLGVGTLAAYGHAGDYFRFYEINPAIVALSQGPAPRFTFLRSSVASTDVILGDARIRMQEEVSRGNPQKFDVLVVDAFTSDSIPVHLLTREAIDLYMRQLRGPESALAFHISNNAIDLKPLMGALSREHHLTTLEVHGRDQYGVESIWILMAADPRVLQIPSLADAGQPLEETRSIRPWTDNYSNLYELLALW